MGFKTVATVVTWLMAVISLLQLATKLFRVGVAPVFGDFIVFYSSTLRQALSIVPGWFGFTLEEWYVHAAAISAILASIAVGTVLKQFDFEFVQKASLYARGRDPEVSKSIVAKIEETDPWSAEVERVLHEAIRADPARFRPTLSEFYAHRARYPLAVAATAVLGYGLGGFGFLALALPLIGSLPRWVKESVGKAVFYAVVRARGTPKAEILEYMQEQEVFNLGLSGGAAGSGWAYWWTVMSQRMLVASTFVLAGALFFFAINAYFNWQ